MPRYKVSDPKTGRTLTIEGDGPPSPQELEELFASAPSPQLEPMKPVSAHEPSKAPERTWGQTANDFLPSAGAVAGSFALGKVPGLSAGAAAVGGAAGQGMKDIGNLINDPIPEGAGWAAFKRLTSKAAEIPGNMVREGGKQGAIDFVGGRVGKYILGPIARNFTKLAFKPAEQAIKTNPNLVEDLLEQGISPTKKGAQKAMDWTTAARVEADDTVRAAQAANRDMRVPTQEILDATVNPVNAAHKPVISHITTQMREEPLWRQLGNYWDDVYKGKPKDLPLEQVREIQRSSGVNAKKVFEGADSAFNQQIEADVNAGAAAALHKRVPGLEELDKETQRRLMVALTAKDALPSAAAGHIPSAADQWLLWQSVFGGHPTMAALAGVREAGRSPRAVSAVARGAHKLQTRQVPQQVLRAANALHTEGAAQDEHNRRTKKDEVDEIWAELEAMRKSRQ
jgi:hypothetical protein